MPSFEPRTRLGKRIAEWGESWEASPRPKPTRRMWLTLAISTVVAGPLVYALLGHPVAAGFVLVSYAMVWQGIAFTLHYRRWKARRRQS